MDKKLWTTKRLERRQAHNVFATTLEVAAAAASTLVEEGSSAEEFQTDFIAQLLDEAKRHRSLAAALELIAKNNSDRIYDDEGEDITVSLNEEFKIKVH
tara:strand:+ start:152 stop:448 length:297 start_codon:yes stop_codon:yes gene_type:complete